MPTTFQDDLLEVSVSRLRASGAITADRDVGRRHLRQGDKSAKRAILRPDAPCSHEVARCARYRDLKDLHVRAQIVSG